MEKEVSAGLADIPTRPGPLAVVARARSLAASRAWRTASRGGGGGGLSGPSGWNAGTRSPPSVGPRLALRWRADWTAAAGHRAGQRLVPATPFLKEAELGAGLRSDGRERELVRAGFEGSRGELGVGEASRPVPLRGKGNWTARAATVIAALEEKMAKSPERGDQRHRYIPISSLHYGPQPSHERIMGSCNFP